MNRSRVLLVACCAILDRDDRVLVSRRHEGAVMPGLWEFPGGKVEPGEQPDAAAVRELFEEVNLTTQIDCLWPLTFTHAQREDARLTVLCYVVRRWRGPLRHQLDQPIAWCSVLDLFKLEMIEENRSLVLALKDYLGYPP